MNNFDCMEIQATRGELSIESRNIFPIIKKWLYSEQDIVFRELISNASDAIIKLSKLKETGFFKKDVGKPLIEITVDVVQKTIRFTDNGIGMTQDEIDKYINQMAYSGASDFVNTYMKSEGSDNIIGHFGLGFYSAFMMADRVSIDSLSWQEGAIPAHWECGNDMQYQMSAGSYSRRGTSITLHMDALGSYASPSFTEKIIKKYFAYFPLDIRLTYVEPEPDGAETKDSKKEPYGSREVNDTSPLWLKNPDECTQDEYVAFYHKAFEDRNDPMFWMHLDNRDLGIKGIIYFRKTNEETQSVDGTFYIYGNQVFVAQNIKEIVPDFVMLQNGIIDCANLPLLVSRSELQNDEQVQAISRWLTEEVTKKMNGLFLAERDVYERCWPHLNAFVKYGCLKNKFFSSVMTKYVIFKTLAGNYQTIREHLERIKDSHENEIFYVSDDIQQAHYIKLFKRAGLDALLMDHVIDQPFIRKLEMFTQGLHFNRIDSDFSGIFRETVPESQAASVNSQIARLMDIVTEVLGKEAEKLDIKIEKLTLPEVSALITLNEQARRVRDMAELYGAVGVNLNQFADMKKTFLLNLGNKLIQFVLQHPSDGKSSLIVRQLYDLARLGQESLEAVDMADFIERSNTALELLCGD